MTPQSWIKRTIGTAVLAISMCTLPIMAAPAASADGLSTCLIAEMGGISWVRSVSGLMGAAVDASAVSSTPLRPFEQIGGPILPVDARDTLVVRGEGRTRINYWGTEKYLSGEDVAPLGWPLPGAPKYALIASVTTGSVTLLRDGRTSGPGQWFLVGEDSGCLAINAPVEGLRFMINDDNLGDNGAGAFGPWAIVYRWTS